MTVKTAAKSFGNGILNAATAVHNATIDNQITQIDSEMDALRSQMARLEESRTKLTSQKI